MPPTARRPRRAALVALVLTTALALTGCAGSGGGSSDAPTAPPLPAAEGTTQYPLTLTTWAGESVLEQRPERIAAIGFSTNLDALQVLGVTPVYSMAEETQYPWRDQQWFSRIEVRDTATRRDPINLEAIAAARPDLIVATNFVTDEETFRRLATIAPVLENPEKIAGDQVAWQDTQRLVGNALDLGGASERAIADAERAMDDTAAAHPQFAGRTVTVATDYTQTGIEYFTVAGGTAEGIVRRLGFVPNPLAANFVADPAVSEEQLRLLDADVLVMCYMNPADREARAQDPLFRSLRPVAEGRYLTVTAYEPGSEITWVLRRGASAVSLPWAVASLADQLRGAGIT